MEGATGPTRSPRSFIQPSAGWRSRCSGNTNRSRSFVLDVSQIMGNPNLNDVGLDGYTSVFVEWVGVGQSEVPHHAQTELA